MKHWKLNWLPDPFAALANANRGFARHGAWQEKLLRGRGLQVLYHLGPLEHRCLFVFVLLGSRIQPTFFVTMILFLFVLPSTYQVYIHSSNGFCETNDRNRFAKVMHMVNVTMRASLHEQFAADQVGGLGIQDQNF